MSEQTFLERHPDVPLAINRQHDLPSGRRCPVNIIPLSHPVSTEHETPIYICPWQDPGSGKTCGARFDKDGRPA